MTSLSIPVSSDGELKVRPEFIIVEQPKNGNETSADGKKKQRGRNKDRSAFFFTSLTDFSIQIHFKKDEESLIKNYSQRLLIGHLK